MSSSSVRAQIVQCQNEIANCEEQIRKLKMNISEKRDAYISFQRKSTNFSEVMTRKKRKSESIFDFSGNTTLAKAYADRIGFELADKSSKEQRLSDIDSQMKNEIQNNNRDLSALESRLASLRNRLSSLQREYQNALQREEEERRAAAALANSSSY